MSTKAQPNTTVAVPLPLDEDSLAREREAATAARTAKRGHADQMLAGLKDAGGKLVERANKSVDPDAATRQAIAAVDLFEALGRLEEAINVDLDQAETVADVADVDLDAMHTAFIRQHPEAFEPIGGRKAVYKPTPPMHHWTCRDTMIELRGSAPRQLAPLKPYPASGFELTWADFFAGAGGSSSGLRGIPGSWVRLAVNHWDLAIETHQYNHQETDHDQASLARTDPSRYPSTDLAWFSPECFPAGTTILTRRGVLPIEQVMVGDEVFTHKLRWRPVTNVMSKRSDTVVVSGYGHSRLETTAEHPFYVRDSKPSYATRRGVGRNGKAYRVPRQYGEAGWVKAGDLRKNHYWSSPTEFGDADVPTIPGARSLTFDADFWWMVGRWLGDGCFRGTRSEVLITCGHHEADDLAKRLAVVDGLNWYRRAQRTATVFSTGHRHLMDWLSRNFGQHADGKTMPAWALGMRADWREALLAGYVSADGGQYDMPDNQRPIVVCSSVSRSLAVGVRMLALSLGWKATLTLNDSRTEGIIEGRRVNMRPLWRVQWSADPSPKHDYTMVENGIRWTPLRGVRASRPDVEVFNISVAEDESYIVDGQIAHNCTYWSVARGEKCDYDDELASIIMDDDDEPEAKEAKWRSRMLMRDVVRFTRHHRYKAVIVENVPDILKWGAMNRWLAEMVGLGYRYKIVTLNSAFANATGAPAPQLRDRVYVVFWRAEYRTPNWDKWLRPKGYCPNCDEIVPAIFNAKPGPRRPMRYGPRSQYTYRCPKKKCHGSTVQPLVRPASDAIDWSLPSQRIGDRKKPLAKKTRDRIQAGIERYWPHAVVETAGHTFERRPGVRTWSVNQPFTTQHTTLSKSLATAPDGLLTPCGGGWNDTARPTTLPHVTTTGRENTALVMPLEGRAEVSSIRPVDGQFRSQTGRHQDGLLQHPGTMLVPLRNNGNAEEPDTTPYRTFAANGNHHALVMRNNNSRGDVGGMCTPTDEPTRTFTASSKQSLIEPPHADALVMRNNHGGAEMCTPTDEPIRTLTTVGHQSLIEHPDHALYSYDTGRLRPLAEPLPAQTTIEGDALFGRDSNRRLVEVDECYLRMLALHEVQEGMAFESAYTLLGKSKRNKVKMLGNAVTPNAARDLGACVMEAITGVDMPLYADDPQFWSLAA